ncbi:MAG TPA: condensation domain-containing protein [Steroidobacteraceae bacterium]|nr:condensation domain-containing protein [Steroidobacteraceae bacterium]
MSKPADKIIKQDSAVPASSGATENDPPNPAESGGEAERTEFPCSVAQERFYLLDRLEPGNASYNVAVRWRLEGRIATDLLERTWLTIIERHEILRTVFLEVDGAPIQRVLPTCPFRIAEIDLSTLPAEQRATEGDRIGVIEARAPFDVNTGPLIRVTLLRFSPTLSIILVTTHQIVSDGWSIGIMAHEMGVIYTALRNNEPAPLEPLPIQYADFSLWQLEWLRIRGTAAETAYWTKQLTGVKPFRVIPDLPRPRMPTTNGTIVSQVLPRALTQRAQDLCVERGATLFAAALGCLCAMLARYTKENDIIVGTQVSDRDQVETEIMIGQFVSSTVLRNDLSGNPRLVDIIDRVRNTTEQALEHRHIPIEHLLGMVKGEYGKTNAAPISVNFIFQKTFIRNVTYPDFSLVDMPSLPVGAIYDLNFFMVERPDGWRFSLQYNTDQFEHDTALRFLGFFQNVLETMVTEPQRRLDRLRLNPVAESVALLERFNGAAAPAAEAPQTVIDLFTARAARSPHAPAVICGSLTLTYLKLSTRAETVAAALRTRGIGLGSRVAICMPRTPELAMLILGLLKIGAACVLLDPADAPEFQRKTLRGGKVSAVIVTKEGRTRLQEAGTLCFDAEALTRADASARQLAAHPGVPEQTEALFSICAEADAEDRCLSVSQIDLGRQLAEIAERIDLQPDDVLVAAAPLGLDSAVSEILLPLIRGACAVLATDGDLKSAWTLQQLFKRVNAKALHAVADTYVHLQRSGWVPAAGFKALCSGERMDLGVVQNLLRHEARVWTFFSEPGLGCWATLSAVRTRLQVNLLGAPLGQFTLSVQDSLGEVTDIGATGALAAGRNAQSKLVKTGDLAKLRADGGIEWLGRDDRRLYVAGHSVDPAHVESLVKARCPVREVLVAKGEPPMDGHLVAYVAVAGPEVDQNVIQAAVSAELDASLPRALRPIVVVVVGSLPVERDGRINWQALRPGHPGSDTAETAKPLHGIEEGIAAIWRSMLNLERIDPEANFFELGSHSLLAARMLARVEATFGRRVTLNTLFQAPTIRALARVIEQKDSREFDFRQMVKLQPNGSRPPLIAINNTGTYYSLAKRLGQDQPVISLQLFDPSVKTAEMPHTLEEVAAGYVELIQRVQPDGPYNLIGWCVAGALAYEIACQLVRANKRVTSLYLMDSWIPRYIERQPLLRRLVSDYSLRWQIVRADWRLVKQKRKVVREFLNDRNGIKAFRGLWNRICNRHDDSQDLDSRKELSREDYDKWLLQYLQSVTLAYEPGRYPGTLTLFRSLEEPTGWFFDPLAGWGAFADNVELVMVSGDHYTMFQEAGARQMAERITATLSRFSAG